MNSRFQDARAGLLQRAAASDSGFTLIEVLTATFLLGIVTTAAIAFAIQGAEASSTQERRNVAIGVATEAMETVNANISATDSATGVSFLFSGRQQSEITTAWSEYSTFPGVSTTYPGWDPTATASSIPRVPLEYTVSRNGTDFEVVTLMGWCYKQSASGNCTTIPTVTTPPAVPPSGWTNRLIRITAIVQWSAGSGCATTACSYQTITLIDGSNDLEWNNG